MEGHPYVHMPNITALAENGFYFRDAITHSPICVPARQAILAGQYPQNCGCRNWGQDIAPDVVTYSAWFSAHGYHTVAAGKMHLQGPDQMKGWNRRIGFEQVALSRPMVEVNAEDQARGRRSIPECGKWCWDDEVRKAGYGEGYWNRHDRYAVDGALMFLDQYFKVIERLRELNVFDGFIIVFESDHGDMLGSHGIWEKFVFFEEAMRAPLMISNPSAKWVPKTVNGPISHLDLYPTLCDLAGIPKPGECDGESLAPLLTDDRTQAETRTVFSELDCHSILDKNKRHSWGQKRQLSIRRDNLKFNTYEMQDRPDQLFDLSTNPDEHNNLTADSDHAPTLRRFQAQAAEFWKQARRPAFPVDQGRWIFERDT